MNPKYAFVRKPWIFTKKEKLRVVNILETIQIRSEKFMVILICEVGLPIWTSFPVHHRGGPWGVIHGPSWSLLVRDFRPVSVFRIIKVEFSFRVFVILDIQRGMHNTFFLAFTEHYISSLYSTQWSFYTVDIRITVPTAVPRTTCD